MTKNMKVVIGLCVQTEKTRTSDSDRHVLLVNTGNHRLIEVSMYGEESKRKKQTINVVVMKLATPRPCGIRSTQRCKADVLSFQQLASTLAKMARNADIRVNVYNFPVLRMSLVVDQ